MYNMTTPPQQYLPNYLIMKMTNRINEHGQHPTPNSCHLRRYHINISGTVPLSSVLSQAGRENSARNRLKRDPGMKPGSSDGDTENRENMMKSGGDPAMTNSESSSSGSVATFRSFPIIMA